MCPDSPDEKTRCDECPLGKLETAMLETAQGQLLQGAIELRNALMLGVTVTLDEIPADEFGAMVLLEQEQGKWEEEKIRAAH